MPQSLRIGILAGEPSGDILGSELIRSLRQLYPDNLQVEGIGGPKMIAAGCRSLFPIERLSVMGITGVITRLPELLKIRKKIIQHFIANPPDVFIGIDYSDFNLTVEETLKKAGIKTVHYVSPKVWAWRRGRLKKIVRAVDLMLTLFPFEADFYQQNSTLPVTCIGHPLADLIPLEMDQQKARTQLGLPLHETIVALLPGSRSNEIHYLGELFLRTAVWCSARMPQLKFVVPLINAQRRTQFEAILQKLAPQISIQLIDGHSQEVMAAADAILLASGTATLEAMLIKRPMAVAYRMSSLNYSIAKLLVKKTLIALPNLLAKKELVPEFIQERATIENLGNVLLGYLQNPDSVTALKTEFLQIHQDLRRNASDAAARAIVGIVSK